MEPVKSLVFEKHDQPMTDSLKVGEYFGKQHFIVLRDIKALECSEEFRKYNFVFSKYRTEQHHWVSKVDMTFDGFMFLAMGYRGKKAARLKEAYIAEFNHMRHWIGCRLAAGDDYKELTEAIKMVHPDGYHSYHFSNEADLINRIVLGISTKRFKKDNGIDAEENSIRPYLTEKQLESISKLQKFDAGLVALLPNYADRKELLLRYYAKINGNVLLQA